MNGSSISPHRSRPRCVRGVAALVGALLVTAPFASASAADATDGAVQASASGPLDVREVLSLQHQRMLDSLGILFGRALLQSSELRFSLQDRVTFGLAVDDFVSVQDDEADELDADPIDDELEDPDELVDDEFIDDEPAPLRRRQTVEYSTDTGDPLAGLF